MDHLIPPKILEIPNKTKNVNFVIDIFRFHDVKSWIDVQYLQSEFLKFDLLFVCVLLLLLFFMKMGLIRNLKSEIKNLNYANVYSRWILFFSYLLFEWICYILIYYKFLISVIVCTFQWPPFVLRFDAYFYLYKL